VPNNPGHQASSFPFLRRLRTFASVPWTKRLADDLARGEIQAGLDLLVNQLLKLWCERNVASRVGSILPKARSDLLPSCSLSKLMMLSRFRSSFTDSMAQESHDVLLVGNGPATEFQRRDSRRADRAPGPQSMRVPHYS
jgi:hypothetical protein